MTLTPELKQAVEKAGDEPVRVHDPETHIAYVLIKEDLYRALREVVPESDLTLHEFEELTTLEDRRPSGAAIFIGAVRAAEHAW
jgi:hypothetical protein